MRLEAELNAVRGNDQGGIPADIDPSPSVDVTENMDYTLSEQPNSLSGAGATLDPTHDREAATYERTSKIEERRPPPDLVCALTSLYFRHIHPWLPFLDVERVYADMGSMGEPPLLYHALFGVSLPYSFDSRLDKASSDSYWKYSKRRIFIEALEEPSYSSLETLTILVLDLSGMTHGPQVWGALAVATRLAIQLGTPQGLVLRASTVIESRNVLSKADHMFRQRLFWAIYALDCYICITTNHESTLGDEQVRHFLPTRHETWTYGSSEAAVSPTAVFCRELELLDVSRRAHRLAAAYLTLREDDESRIRWIDGLRGVSSELENWIQLIPSRFGWLDATNGHIYKGVRPAVVMLHGLYHALVIYINGFISISPGNTPDTEDYAAIRQVSLDRCLHSINVLSRLVSEVAISFTENLGWPFAWATFIAARFLIAQTYKTGQTEPRTATTLATFSSFLLKMGQYWQISLRYSQLIRQAISDLDPNIPRRPSSIASLMADLRVSTSNLEDHIRSDPIIHRADTEDEPSASYEELSCVSFGNSAELFGALPDNVIFDMVQPEADAWFREPLFASSAYQQYHITEPGQ